MPKNSYVKYYILLLKYLQKFWYWLAKSKKKERKILQLSISLFFPDWFPKSHHKIKNLLAVQPINE